MIYLTDSEGAAFLPGMEPFGHTALAIQDDEGNWWLSTYEPIAVLGAPVVIHVLTPINDANVDKNGVLTGNYCYEIEIAYFNDYPTSYRIEGQIGRYDSQLYIECNSNPSLERAQEFSRNHGAYNLVGNNCCYRTLEIMMPSLSPSQRTALTDYMYVGKHGIKIKRTIVPNDAVNVIKAILSK
jgi:hypothetical protein